MPPTTRSRQAAAAAQAASADTANATIEETRDSSKPDSAGLVTLPDRLTDPTKRRRRGAKRLPVVDPTLTPESSVSIPSTDDASTAAELFKTVQLSCDSALPHILPPVMNAIIPGFSGVPIGPVLFTMGAFPPNARAVYKPIRQKAFGVARKSLASFPLMHLQGPQKHSLRLVRGNSSSWTVVSPDPLLSVGNSSVNAVTLPKVVSSATSQPPLKLAAMLAAKQTKLKGSPVLTVKKVKSPGRKKKGKVTGKRQKRKGFARKTDSAQSGSSTSTTTDVESFRSDADTGEGTSSGFSQQQDSVISSSVREDSVSGEVDNGVGPLYTQAQKEAMADHFDGDTAAAARYSALKEWAVAKGSSVLHGGVIKNKFRSILTETLDGEESSELSIAMLDRIKEKIRRVNESSLEEFKRQICIEIIKSRNPQYSVLRKDTERSADS